ELLNQGLAQTFQQIAMTTLTLTIENQECSVEILNHYWQHFIRQVPSLLPNHVEMLVQQPIEINEGHIIAYAKTEAEAVSLQRKLQPAFQRYIETTGLKPYVITFQVTTTTDELESFRMQTYEEDRENAINTMMKQQEQMEKQDKETEVTKLQIGYHIQDEPVHMEEINEEEKRMTVQGYVFNVEVRKLRSGRSLLLIKATDYTDSLEIKMFSRNDDDGAMFDAVKSGIWIKARGRIQTDMYSNELTMMANDIEQVDVAQR